MRGILIITEDIRGLASIQSALIRENYRVAITPPDEDALTQTLSDLTPEIIMVDCRTNNKAMVESRRFLAAECNLKEILGIAFLTTEQAIKMDFSGIDDFLVEPFDGEELVARLRLLSWRTKKISSDQIIKIDDLTIDMMNYDINIDGVPVELTFKEYELLKFMATHRGRVFTREALLDHVWGYDYYGGTRTVDVHIRRLRAKLGPICDSLIETVRNVGYRFTAE